MIEKTDLYKRIIDKLELEPGLDESSISIAVKNNDIVVLGGEVASYAEKCLAEQAIQKIKGVKGIADELKVNLVTPFARSDLDIANSAIDALKSNFFVPKEGIKIIVENGALILSGEVDKYYQKEHAEKAVQNLVGLVGVVNNISVKADLSVQAVKKEIIKEFERNARIDANSIEVEVQNNTVILKGKVKSLDKVKEAKLAAWSVLGVNNVINQLEVE
jgi:osmotically-inducible protein OsmY